MLHISIQIHVCSNELDSTEKPSYEEGSVKEDKEKVDNTYFPETNHPSLLRIFFMMTDGIRTTLILWREHQRLKYSTQRITQSHKRLICSS